MSLIGLVGGFLVGMTSVGSGSIIMMLLLLFYSFVPKVMVGTDIVHAVILTGVTSLLHWRARQCGYSPGNFAADRFDSRRNPGLAVEHARSGAVAAKNSVRSAADDGSKNAVGVKKEFSVPGSQFPVKAQRISLRNSKESVPLGTGN